MKKFGELNKEEKEEVKATMEDEKYYICKRCGELKTQNEILKDAEQAGSIGMCYCSFTETVWNERIEDLDVITPREFIPYTEISKKWYDQLVHIKNEVLRLMAFKEIPADKRTDDTPSKNPAHFCLNCDKYLGHRGFCSKNCHDEWYDKEYPD